MFLHLTSSCTNKPITINTDGFSFFEESNGGTLFYCNEEESVTVKETYEEVKKLVDGHNQTNRTGM